MYGSPPRAGRCWPPGLPGAQPAEPLSAFLTFLFSFLVAIYVLLTTLDERLGQFRPALNCACANFDSSRGDHLFPFTKIRKHRVPARLIQTPSPHLLYRPVRPHEHRVRNACETELDIGPIGRVGQ